MKKLIALRIDNDISDYIKSTMERTGLSASSIIRMIIYEKIKSKKLLSLEKNDEE